MFSSVSDFFEGAQPSIALFNAFSSKQELEGTAASDHICYKCGSSDVFEKVRALFENESAYIYQSIISKRRIAYIRFLSPLHTALGPIWYLELSDQKPDGSQQEGFDHIEAYPVAGSYEEMVASLALSNTVVHVHRPHHTTDDVDVGEGFLFRCTQGPLIEKIKDSEMK